MLAHLSWATHNLLVHVQTRVGSCTDQTQVRETAHSSHETSIIFSQRRDQTYLAWLSSALDALWRRKTIWKEDHKTVMT